MRTQEGMKVTRAKGRLRGKQPKLTVRQEAHLAALPARGEYTFSELAELFRGGRSHRLPGSALSSGATSPFSPSPSSSPISEALTEQRSAPQ
jgi:hypothetical protein